MLFAWQRQSHRAWFGQSPKSAKGRKKLPSSRDCAPARPSQLATVFMFAPDRGCVVLDQPQHVVSAGNPDLFQWSHTMKLLRLVCDTAALRGSARMRPPGCACPPLPTAWRPAHE
jgi:hypothetical protein